VVRTEEMARKCRKRNDFFFYRLRLTLGHHASIEIEADSDNGLEHGRWRTVMTKPPQRPQSTQTYQQSCSLSDNIALQVTWQLA